MSNNKRWSTLLLLAITYISNINGKVPDYINICSKKNNLTTCLMENFKNVVSFLSTHDEPSFQVSTLAAVRVPKIDLQATPDLQVYLKDVVFTGLDKSNIIELTYTDNELHFLAHFDEVNFEGEYKMNGKILILPIQGEGTMKMTLNNYDMNYKAKLKTDERKGKKFNYLESTPEGTHLAIENIQKVFYRFDNLFGGDPRLGPEMNKFLNENWKDVYNEIQIALEQVAAFSVINPIINGYLKHIPIDELFLSDSIVKEK